MKFSKEEFDQISEAIKKVEAKTTGEILPLLVEMSDFYPAAHFRLSLIFVFIFGLLSLWLFPQFDPYSILFIQFLGLVLGYFLAYWTSVKRHLITREERIEEVHQRALQAFFLHQLHHTPHRNGILVMISLMERRVEILADAGIHSKVSSETWNQFVSQFRDEIHHENLTTSFIHLIEKCGEILVEQFPLKEGEKRQTHHNKLTDRLIIEE